MFFFSLQEKRKWNPQKLQDHCCCSIALLLPASPLTGSSHRIHNTVVIMDRMTQTVFQQSVCIFSQNPVLEHEYRIMYGPYDLHPYRLSVHCFSTIQNFLSLSISSFGVIPFGEIHHQGRNQLRMDFQAMMI